MADFGMPPKGDEIRELITQRLKHAMTEAGAKVTVDWRGEPRHLYVISMPVDLLYFNPDTHRIRAQRTLDPVRNQAIDADPWGEDAQTYLHDLLRQRPANPDQVDPDFTALKDELDDSGQREPGIVSPHGILVDGNTRAAALRDLGVQNIKVGVLPDDTSRLDINSVELTLQLRQDRRRDYSYINRLIAIDEELSRGRTEADVAKDFNIKPATLQRDRWVYGLILDAIDRSKTTDGASLRLVDFEQHQEKLRELHRDYSNLAKSNPDAATRLKQSRLAMVLLDYPKTSLRLAEDDFHTRYLDPRLPEDLKPTPASATAVSVPGLPGVTMPGISSDSAAAEALTDRLLRAKAVAHSGSISTTSDVTAAADVMRRARETFDVAVKMAGQNAELVKRQTAVPERLTDAAEYVTQCANEFAEAKAKRALDEEAFDDALIVLRESLAGLARQAGRTFTAPGEGVAWLLDTVRAK
ncbi:ParB N-terminal domain-containing protein [Demequina iriomotensis]|uniref:ParB N-terminal domain-containing protein n=1 Tax=Demequina iriomotensis TaxID=1536641 RepID=UPI000780F6AA|nr:ParB N-terminal domain-containing protein [Demequina iriomotensis]